MTREVEDFIRDESEVDSWFEDDGDGFEDEEIVCECGFCGDTIYAGDTMFAMIFAGINETHTLRLCKYCARSYGGSPHLGEVFDALGGESKAGDAEDVEAWLTDRAEEFDAHRVNMHRITTARQILMQRGAVTS